MKKISELTDKEAEEILEYVYPGKTKLFNPKKYDYWFDELHFEPLIENEQMSVGFDMRPIVGIGYKNNMGDRCRIHFDDIKVMSWLYQHGYDITEELKQNEYLSEFENDMDNVSFELYQMSIGEENFGAESKHNCTREYYIKKSKELLETYFYKNYE